MRLRRVEEGIHLQRNTSFPGLLIGRSVYINRWLELGEHHGSIISSTGRTGEIPWMSGKKV